MQVLHLCTNLAGLLLQAEGALLGHEGTQLALPLLNFPISSRLLHIGPTR